MTNPTPEAIEALRRARDLAMDRAARTRIPECGDFGAIAQDLDAVLTALAQRQRVKKLVWDSRNPESQFAFSGFGDYVVQYEGVAAWGMWTPIELDGDDARSFHKTDTAAKSAAQADYEARILSALEPDPTGGGCSDMEAAPYDEVVRVKLGTGMSIEAVLRREASLDRDETSCDQWQAAHESEHPECWTDGACWESNSDGMISMQPTAWQRITPPVRGQEKE